LGKIQQLFLFNTKKDMSYNNSEFKKAMDEVISLVGGGGSPIASGYSTATAGATASDLIASLNASTNLVQIQSEEEIRIKLDGSDPTASEGFVIQANAIVSLSNEEALAARIIKTGGDDVAVNIQEYS